MKITFVTPGLTGGGGRVIMEYAKGLLARGHETRILYPRKKSGFRHVLRNLYLQLRYTSRDKWVRAHPGDIVAYNRLTPELVGQNDAVVGVGADCVLEIASLPASCGLKINNCHGREVSNKERMFEAWRLRMPRIVVASHLVREMRQQGCSDEIYVVYNGVDRKEYFPSVPVEQRCGVGTVFHGAFTKDPELMLAVFQRLHQRRPGMPLMMFGSYPQPASLPPGTHYLRLPPIAAARDMYSRANVWFCASRSEGFPGPVLEAMACGCPVVATDCGGTSDQIEDGVNGFIVPVDDATQMTERVLKLVEDPSLREQFVAASEAKLKEFTWPRAIQTLETALKAIVAKSGTGMDTRISV